MDSTHSTELMQALAWLGYLTLTDLFIGQPTLNFWTAAALLSGPDHRTVPVEIERALKHECKQRDDPHFFVRTTLFSVFHDPNGKGWDKQHYLLAGFWFGMLGGTNDGQCRLCWDCLESMNLPDGWKPTSIFDPALESALNRGFASQPVAPVTSQNIPVQL